MNGVARSRMLGCLAAVVAMFGVAACGGTAGSGAAATGPSASPSPSPSYPPPPMDKVAEYVMVSSNWTGPEPGWKLVYDDVRQGQNVEGCGSTALTPSDMAKTQREWQNGPDKSSGAGESAVVLGASDAIHGQASSGPSLRNQGRGRAAVAAVEEVLATCQPQIVNGTTISPVPDVVITMPLGAKDVKMFCDKSETRGRPTDFSCFASLGVYDVYLMVYGWGPTVGVARENFRAIVAEAVQHVAAIP